ncbi:hypothetical protein CACET_c25380 [Clostridium aceticum]|uniref:Uncharacterized protein n=1 Tax=Clostridium aceticum TaxID=84022 RepID=A0A0D8IAM0_9CLOT|nr:hypothetical protein [Clostridium aceticum]AKL95983.1 hypothetical protein CACET_c25380 [Clostridium aceticum]KJF27072.1 hypothetical protein TZ02_09740 [Clostridium aceticum]
MHHLKNMCKSFIMMFSEIIWIYYAIVLFTSVEWRQAAFFDLRWFIVAGITGYVFNRLVAKSRNHVFLFLGNILAIGFMIVQNWKTVVPEGSWGFGLAVSIGLTLIFARSARLTQKQPTRLEMLRRFEGNIIYYIVFALVFTGNNWRDNTFHLFFIVAIGGSLIGMILTLQSLEDGEGSGKVKVMKVGESGWFAGVVGFLLICIPLFSLILLLPSVNRGLYTLAAGVWERGKWIALKISSFLNWFFSLFPDSETETIPTPPPQQTIIPSEVIEEPLVSLPYMWMIGGAILLLAVAAIWFFTRALINRQLPKAMKPRQMMIIKESWWINFKRNIKAYLKHLKLKWCMYFPYFYHHPIYWRYHQVLRWGEKNGLSKAKSETSQEYMKKVSKAIPEKEKNFCHEGKSYDLSELFTQLNRDYQAIYYGMNVEIPDKIEYKFLIHHLQRISLKRRKL